MIFETRPLPCEGSERMRGSTYFSVNLDRGRHRRHQMYRFTHIESIRMDAKNDRSQCISREVALRVSGAANATSTERGTQRTSGTQVVHDRSLHIIHVTKCVYAGARQHPRLTRTAWGRERRAPCTMAGATRKDEAERATMVDGYTIEWMRSIWCETQHRARERSHPWEGT